MINSRFWIRKDREQYFFNGIIITCVIGGFVSSYWHFSDRINVRQDIKIRKSISTEKQQKKLREVQYAPVKLGAGATRYYRLESDTLPSVPELGDNDGE